MFWLIRIANIFLGEIFMSNFIFKGQPILFNRNIFKHEKMRTYKLLLPQPRKCERRCFHFQIDDAHESVFVLIFWIAATCGSYFLILFLNWKSGNCRCSYVKLLPVEKLWCTVTCDPRILPLWNGMDHSECSPLASLLMSWWHCILASVFTQHYC